MNKAIFLDRDGVINTNENFVNSVDDLEYIPGIFEFCLEAKHKGFMLIVITNQGGIGAGYITIEEHDEIRRAVMKKFRRSMCELTDYLHCPHHPQMGCNCRKPKPGMILRAAARHKIDLTQSYLVGDMPTDIEAGIAAGIPHLQCFLFRGKEWPELSDKF